MDEEVSDETLPDAAAGDETLPEEAVVDEALRKDTVVDEALPKETVGNEALPAESGEEDPDDPHICYTGQSGIFTSQQLSFSLSCHFRLLP